MWRTNLTLAIVATAGLLGLCVSAQASDPNLVAHWMLDEGTGSIAYDSAGGNDGTIYGASWTTGQVAGALEFHGTDDYVDLPDGFADFTDGFTVALWANPTQANWYARFIEFGNGSSNDNIIFTRVQDTNDLLFVAIAGSGPGLWVVAEEAIELDIWQYFAASLDDSGNVVIYKNGAPVASGQTAAARNVTRVRNYIGRSNWSVDDYYRGRMDDIRVYNRCLSAEEVEQLYWEGLSWSALAIGQIEDAIAKKVEALETIDAALEKEWAAYDALNELLASGDYEGLSKRDIAAAQRKIESSIRRQQRSKRVIQGSIEELEDALLSLSWEPEPEPNMPEPEPNMPVPAKLLKGPRGRR